MKADAAIFIPHLPLPFVTVHFHSSSSISSFVIFHVEVPPHHHVYVVFLRNPAGDGRAGYYVGMTGLSPEERFANHKKGIKAANIVRRFGERLVPRLYAHLNPMTYEDAVKMEQQLAEELRAAGYQVFGGH